MNSSRKHSLSKRLGTSSSFAGELVEGVVHATVGVSVVSDDVPAPVDASVRRALSSRGSKVLTQGAKEDSLSVVLPPCDVNLLISVQDIVYQVQVPDPDRPKDGIFRKICVIFGLAGKGAMIPKIILHPMSIQLHPYRLTALIGSSGAGKSTLLNVVSGRVKYSGGLVTYNGDPLSSDIRHRHCAFVQQLDIFLNHLSVQEHLKYQTELRLPSTFTKAQRKERQHLLEEQMNLVKCKQTVIGVHGAVGGISGGERKRLNVASEICTMPSVLFADEPSTGLDSFMALSVVQMLRSLALSGRTVVSTIHQPSSRIFELFDDVILLAEGRLIYAGDRLGCIQWLADLGYSCPHWVNPADFIIKVVSIPENLELAKKKIEQIVEWEQAWQSRGAEFTKNWKLERRQSFISQTTSFSEALNISAAGKTPPLSSPSNASKLAVPEVHQVVDVEAPSGTPEAPLVSTTQTKGSDTGRINWFRQVGILYRRSNDSNKRDRFLVHSRAAQSIILGLIFGFLMFRLGWTQADAQSRFGAFYNIIVNQSMVGAFAVTNTFTFEKPVIKREYESGFLHSSAYMVAKMLADAPVQIVFPIIFCTIAYWLIGLNDNFGAFVVSQVILLLVSNCAMSIGYLASSAGNSPEIASIICNLMMLPLLLFGGFLVELSQSPVWLSWIQYLSFIQYGFSAGCITVFRGTTVYLPDGSTIPGLSFIKQLLGFSESAMLLNFIMLVVLLIVFRALGLVLFTWSLRRHRENE